VLECGHSMAAAVTALTLMAALANYQLKKAFHEPLL
jgi:hypothetical protein